MKYIHFVLIFYNHKNGHNQDNIGRIFRRESLENKDTYESNMVPGRVILMKEKIQ